MIPFTLDFIEHRRPGDLVPALFPLASWDPGRQSLRDWMSARLAADYPALGVGAPSGRSWAWELVEGAGRVLPVLDGLDEIPGSLRHEAGCRQLNVAVNSALPDAADLPRRRVRGYRRGN